ncbi:unnamed protein product, partial [Meganyctiphanes norvegica]
ECGSWDAVKHLSFRVDERILDKADSMKENGGAAALHNSATNLGAASQKCGATLISDRYLLTAAHCMTSTERLIGISLGRKDLSVDPQPGPNTYEVQGVFIHPLYKPGSHKYNDIALVKTDRKVTFSPNIWPYCLPQANETYKDYDTVIIAGYGLVGAHKSPTIKTAYINIVDNLRCEEKWRQDQEGADYYDTVLHRYSYPDGLTQQVLCAGRDGVDACGGDSGGPMSHQNSGGEHVAIGLVAQGLVCAEYPTYPGFYTNVANYIGWINKITGLSSPTSPNGSPQPRPPPTQRPVERFTTPATIWIPTTTVSSTTSPNGSRQPRPPPTRRPFGRFTTTEKLTLSFQKCSSQSGSFADDDKTLCYLYYTCDNGQPIPNFCNAGLHFDESSGICNWPRDAGRKNCEEGKEKKIMRIKNLIQEREQQLNESFIGIYDYDTVLSTLQYKLQRE